MEIEVTWGRAAQVWWAYLWRNVVAFIAASMLGGMLGLVIGVALVRLGFSETAIQYVTTPIGVLIGLAFSVIPMKIILGKDFGKFRLVLVSK